MDAIVTHAAIMTATATVFGAVIVFILLFLVLERKKKTLIFLFLLALTGYGIFYWYEGKTAPVVTEIPVGPTVLSTVRAPRIVPPHPHVKKVIPLPVPCPC